MFAETLVALLAAHFAADFLFQTNWMVQHKRKLAPLSLHLLILAVTAALAVAVPTKSAAIAIALTLAAHGITDLAKSRLGSDSWRWFVADQMAHIAVAVAIAWQIPIDFTQNLFLAALPPATYASYFWVLIVFTGLVAAVMTGRYLIEKVMADMQMLDTANGHPGAGAAIGMLERFMIFLFVFIGQMTAIGFLIAAKSILRFKDIESGDDRKLTEYIIVGTLLSFSWAIAIAMLTKQAAAYWIAS